MYKLFISYHTKDNFLYQGSKVIKLEPFVFATLDSLIAAYELLSNAAPASMLIRAVVEEEVTIKQKREVEKSLADLKKMK